jgi:Uma2 family endonuclease
MSTQTVEDYLSAIEHLPDGVMLRLEHISWDDYEQLLEDLILWPGMRVSYDHGRVEIMSPTSEHEEYKGFILRLVHVLTEEANIILEARGSSTIKQKRLRKGAEPDECFYVQNANAIIGKRTIDLNVDPPPDVIVEIDITSESLSKFPIYAAFGVPEIWRYDGQQAWMYRLIDQDYVEIESSIALPILTPPVLVEFLELSKTHGQSVALAAFRLWVREGKQA